MAEPLFLARTPTVGVEALPPSSIRILRTRAHGDRAMLRRISALFGVDLPCSPNRASGGQPRILWLAPGEWMIVGDETPHERILTAADSVLATHVAEVGDGYSCYEISGRDAGHLLACGCALDLHESVFDANSCAQTAFAHLFAIIHRRESMSFNLYVDMSCSDYLERWFRDALTGFPP